MLDKLQYFDVKVIQRDDGWWDVSVPDLPEVTTQSAKLNDVKELARHAIGSWLECSPDLVVITVIA